MEDYQIKGLTVVRESTDNTKKFLQNAGNSCGANIDIVVCENPNNVSLTLIYEQFLQQVRQEEKPTIAVIMHDDIEFMKAGWGKELIRMFNENPEYGIIGVAGSAQFDEKGAWWNYPKKYGQVMHRHQGKAWVTPFSELYQEDLKETCCVDGLFMAIEPKRVGDFDEKIPGFDFYDIDFCLSNFVNKTCKIGVTTKVRIAHNSIGEMKPQWAENLKLINEKYGKYYPISVK